MAVALSVAQAGMDTRGSEYELVRDAILRTEWYTKYEGLVIGALKNACAESPTGTAIALCIEGGPITRVESETMDKIVGQVSFYQDKGKTDQAIAARVIVERCTWEEFQQSWVAYEETVHDPFGKFTGVCHSIAINADSLTDITPSPPLTLAHAAGSAAVTHEAPAQAASTETLLT